MAMYFQTAADALYMNGHGVYVWSVYGVAARTIGGLSVAPVLKRRRFIREESQRLRRERQAAAGRVGG